MSSRSLSLFLITACLASAGLPAQGAVGVGRKAPALVVEELDGTIFDLAAQRGHVVVVNIWATWCGPCRTEMPLLNDFYRRFHGRGVVLLGLSADALSDASTVRSVMKKYRYPAALAKAARSNGFAPIVAVPVTYVIDRQGVVRAKFWGGGATLTRDGLDKLVTSLLGP